MPFLAVCGLLSVLLLAGCARVPASSTAGTRSKLLEVTVQFREPVNINRVQPPGNYYFVLINRTDNNADPGPAPLVTTPWGNGFAAASQPDGQGFVGFVRFDRNQGVSGYGVYSCFVNGELRNPTEGNFTPLGQPDAVLVVPQPGESTNTLSFRLDLGRLPNPEAQWIQINILATNNLPQDTNPDAIKVWDALGNGGVGGFINGYITLDARQNRILTNDDLIGDAQEPPNDVRDKLGPLIDDGSLDIVDWSIRILDR